MTSRERVWKAIDDAAIEGHGRLQDALYRLLVVVDTVECAPSRVDYCLDRADEALRGGGAVAVMQAREAVEDLVAMLAAGISSARCGENVVREDPAALHLPGRAASSVPETVADGCEQAARFCNR